MVGSSPKPPPKPDNSVAEEQLRIQRESREEGERRNRSRLRNIRSRASRQPLLFDGFAGVGGGAGGGSSNLGSA